MSVQVKICGIKTIEALEAAISGGAAFIGFVFFKSSPRNIDIGIAKELCSIVPEGVRSVGLFVNPSDEELEIVLKDVRLDMLQLHGNEPPKRVREIKKRFGLPVIKAFSVSTAADVVGAYAYEDVADWFVFDAKAPEGSRVPGGTGQSFDWALLAEEEFEKPWMLSGGLSLENVENALMVLSPTAVDVSSGVESSRGEKDVAKIKAFLATANKV